MMLLRGFASLPDEIVFLIITFLANPIQFRQFYAQSISRLENLPGLNRCHINTRALLSPLSMTCARLRALCTPVMFKRLVLTSGNLKGEYLPSNVLAHYRIIHMHSSWNHRNIEAVLRATTNIRKLIHWGSSDEPMSPFIFTLPRVMDITLYDPPISAESPVLPTCGSLRAFRVLFQNMSMSRMPSADIQAQRDFVLSQISASRSSLEELLLPRETTNLAGLSQHPWPSLLQLTLLGECVDDPGECVLLVDVLAQFPRLRALTLALLPRQGELVPYIWPPGTVREHPPVLGSLVRVSLSFPRDDDLLFPHLPSGLVELALRDSPRSYNLSPARSSRSQDATQGGYAASRPLLTCAAAARLFTVVPLQPFLERLEIVVQAGPGGFDAAEAETYARAASACPNLRVLELHRCRAAETTMVPVAAIVEALAAFSQLREVRLNLDLPQIGDFDFGLRHSFFYVDDEKMSPIYDSAATLVAEAMPWLERVVFLKLDSRRSDAFYWVTWAVRKASDSDGARVEMLDQSSQA